METSLEARACFMAVEGLTAHSDRNRMIKGRTGKDTQED